MLHCRSSVPVDWSSDMFFTRVDPRKAVSECSQGSAWDRPIWAGQGRKLIGNLTTVTTSVREFAVLIAAIEFSSEVLQINPRASQRDAILVFEQVAAYGLLAHDRLPARGVERARRRWMEGRFTISARPEDQILSRQETPSGVLGLFASASRASGLVESRRLELTIQGKGVLGCPESEDVRSTAWRDLVARTSEGGVWKIDRNRDGSNSIPAFEGSIQNYILRTSRQLSIALA